MPRKKKTAEPVFPLEKIDPNALPNIEDIGDYVEKALRRIYKDAYEKYVIRQDTQRFLVLPPRYLHLPPALVSIQSHPRNSKKALFVSITRRIPVTSEEDFDSIMSRIPDLIGCSLEIMKRPRLRTSEQIKLKYLIIGTRVHVLSLRDFAWFLLILSSVIIRVDDLLLEIERTSEEVFTARDHEESMEYT